MLNAGGLKYCKTFEYKVLQNFRNDLCIPILVVILLNDDRSEVLLTLSYYMYVFIPYTLHYISISLLYLYMYTLILSIYLLSMCIGTPVLLHAWQCGSQMHRYNINFSFLHYVQNSREFWTQSAHSTQGCTSNRTTQIYSREGNYKYALPRFAFSYALESYCTISQFRLSFFRRSFRLHRESLHAVATTLCRWSETHCSALTAASQNFAVRQNLYVF